MKATVPAKVILTGEHSVVYGKKALGAAVDLKTHLTLTIKASETPGIAVEFQTETSYLSWEQAYQSLEEVSVVSVLSFLSLEVFPDCFDKLFEFKIDSELPVRSGLGSSAALCVAASGLLLRTKNSHASLQEINELAIKGENKVHGRASGIDNTVILNGGVLCFQAGSFESLEVVNPESVKVLLVNSKVPRAAMGMISGVRMLNEEYPQVVTKIFEGIDSVTSQCKNSIQAGNYEKVKQMMHMNQGLLYSLGVSTSVLNDICNIGFKHGLLGKMTGAGGGGFCVFLVTNEDTSGAVAEWTAKGYEVIETKFTNQGLVMS